jgi:hypothetical protein
MRGHLLGGSGSSVLSLAVALVAVTACFNSSSPAAEPDAGFDSGAVDFDASSSSSGGGSGDSSGSGSGGGDASSGKPPVITAIAMKNPATVMGRGAPGTEVVLTGTNLVPQGTAIGTGATAPGIGIYFGTMSAGSVYADTATTIETAIPTVPSYATVSVTVHNSFGVSAPFSFMISCNQTGESCGVDPGGTGGTGNQGCCNGCDSQIGACK